jgi:DNA-binding Xre family transcriptional regulator
MLQIALQFLVNVRGIAPRQLAERVCINRATLSRLQKGKDARLTWEQIVALDRECACAGQGFLARPRWLEHLTRAGAVQFAVASYERKAEQRNDVSIWDLHSTAEAMRDCYAVRHDLRIDIHTSVRREVANPPHSSRDWEKLAKSSVLVIGSPRANYTSEYALSGMFGLQPFTRPRTPPPFAFAWPGNPYTSAFSDPDRPKGWGLRVGDAFYPEDRDGGPRGERTTYGVVAIHSHDGGTTVVCSGLTGPGTLACVRALSRVPELRMASIGAGANFTAWAAVQAVVQESDKYGENRTIEEPELVSGPHQM